MAKFEINEAGIAALEERLQRQMAEVSERANAAAAEKDSLDEKVEAYAQVLEGAGLKDVNREVIRRQMQAE